MDFREKLEQSREKAGNESANRIELEEAFSCEFFATDNIKSLPDCLDLRLPDGKRKALPDSFIAEIDFDTEGGIEITTAKKKINITGRGLGKLYDYLVAYRVRYIKANIGADRKDEGLIVEEIIIEELT